ncbi:virB8 family protein [Halomonas sp. 3D7M]|uniref:virB8 family protein n=1 Tax=Halomonas sp. 3D7M TaxID=2742617 RepID=UPI001867B815|nr:type IV secretion system protein [Halomonas sp. 3D7M]
MLGLKKKSSLNIQRAHFEENKCEEKSGNNPLAKKEAKRLIEQTKKLEKSEADKHRKLAKFAIFFACFFGLATIAMAVAIAFMMPLKSVEPYVIRTDNTSGYVEVATPLTGNRGISEQEAVTRHFVAQYVLARESYDWFMIRHNYDRVKALSSDRIFSAYDRVIRSENSALEILGEKKRAEVTITNITFVGDVAQVRFNKKITNVDGSSDYGVPARNWIATISYDYPNEEKTYSERLLNPLNFKVVGYNVDPESGVEE